MSKLSLMSAAQPLHHMSIWQPWQRLADLLRSAADTLSPPGVPRDPLADVAFSELANALQVAAPLSTSVRVAVGAAGQDLVNLETAIMDATRAVRALRHLRQQGGVL